MQALILEVILPTTYIRFKGSRTYLVTEVKSNKMF